MLTRFHHYILGTIDPDRDIQTYYSAVFICYFLLIACLTLSFFTFFNLFFNHNYSLAVIDCSFAGISGLILLDLKRRQNIDRAAAQFIAMLFTILVLFFLVSKPESSAFVWVFCFITATSLIYGKNRGLLLNLAFCTVAFGYYYFSIGDKITLLGYINLVSATFIIMLFLRFYEASFTEIFIRLQQALSELKASHAELESRSITDPLTDTYNRAKAGELLTTAIDNQARYGTPFSIIFLDIDKFKAINDQYGHDAGDDILIKYARLFTEHIRKTDAVIRWGGEEFMILCPNTNRTEATNLAENLRSLCARERLGAIALPSASYGVAEYAPNENIVAFIKRADTAMYTAKHCGGNRVEIA